MSTSSQLELPSVVRECTNPVLRNRAIAIFSATTSTRADRDQVIFEIIQEVKTREETERRIQAQASETLWREWFNRLWIPSAPS
jgi:hypothetical protein